MLRFLPTLILCLSTGIIAFFAGKKSTTPSEKIAAQEQAARLSRAAPHQRTIDSQTLRQERVARAATNPNAMRTSMAEALATETDPLSRSLDIFTLLEVLDESNWKEVLQAMDDAAALTGKPVPDQYNDIYSRIGKVAGAAAVDYFVSRGEAPPRALFYGWGLANPDLPMKWIEDHQEDLKKDLKWVAASAFGGVTLAHPERAKEIMKGLEKAQWDELSWQFTRNLVRAEGIDGNDRWLTEVLSSDRDEDSKHATITHAVEWVAHATKAGRSPQETLAWYQKFGTRGEKDHRGVSGPLIFASLDHSVENAGTVIEGILEKGVDVDVDYLASRIAREKTPKAAELAEWLDTQGNTEFADAIRAKIPAPTSALPEK